MVCGVVGHSRPSPSDFLIGDDDLASVGMKAGANLLVGAEPEAGSQLAEVVLAKVVKGGGEVFKVDGHVRLPCFDESSPAKRRVLYGEDIAMWQIV